MSVAAKNKWNIPAHVQEIALKGDKLLEQVNRITAKADAEKRPTSAEETVKCREILVDVKALHEDFESQVQLYGDARLYQQSFDSLDEPVDVKSIADVSQAARPENKAGRPDPECKWHPVYSKDEEETLKKYFRSSHKDHSFNDPEYKALSSYSDPAGGYILGKAEYAQIVETMKMIVQLKPLVTVVPLNNAESISVKSYAFAPTIYKLTEGEDFETSALDTTSDFFGKEILTPGKRGGMIKVPIELVSDSSYPLESMLNKSFAESFALAQDEDIIKGSGVGGPKGFLDCLTDTAGGVAGGQNNYDVTNTYDANTFGIAPKDINAVKSRLKIPYRRVPTCRLILPTAVLQVIMDFRQNSDGADTGSFMWQPVFASGHPPTLRGMPYVEVEDAQWKTYTADGDPLFAYGDLSKYLFVERQGFTVIRLGELYATTQKIGYMYVGRWDGILADSKAIIRFNRQAA